MMVESLKVYGRWLAVLPGALGAAWLAHIVVRLGGVIGGSDSWFLGRLYLEASGGLAMGVAFVYCGGKIAPNQQKNAIYVLTGLAILIAGFTLYPALLVQNLWAILNALCIVVGAGGVAYSVSLGEGDFA
jgi:hypothetical protein